MDRRSASRVVVDSSGERARALDPLVAAAPVPGVPKASATGAARVAATKAARRRLVGMSGAPSHDGKWGTTRLGTSSRVPRKAYTSPRRCARIFEASGLSLIHISE